MSEYSISPAYATSNSACVDWSADNLGGSFNVRVSIAVFIGDTTNSVGTILGSTLVETSGPNSYWNGTACAYGLGSSTTYRFVMSVRRASDFSLLGTRTTYVTTDAPPPPPAPVISGSFSGGTVGSTYDSGSSVVASNSPTTWSRSGNLPPGLVGSDGGSTYVVTGTPTTAGTYNFSLTASNAGGSDTESFSITIAPAPTPTTTVPEVRNDVRSVAEGKIQDRGLVPSVTLRTSGADSSNDGKVATQSPGAGTTVDVGSTVALEVYNYVIPQVNVANVVGSSEASARTTLQGQGFSVSSTPTAVGADAGNTGKVKSQNPLAGTAANVGSSVSIVVYNYVPPQVTVPNVVTETQASAISILEEDGFVVNTGTTTSGANSANNGTVASQNPSAGSSAALGSAVTISIYTFTPPVWTDNTIVNTFVVGTSYSDSVAATNSPSYSVTSGTLPAGISINSITGAITGTPTTSGDYSFVISATNSFGSVSVTYGGEVTAPPVWSDQTLANFLQGRVYLDAVAASNSPTYTVTSGSLPVGISLNSTTGAVTGTPTGSGNYSFTISAANRFATITASFSGTIKLPPNWTDNQLGSFINGVDYSDSVTATNSPTYSVSAGTLPTGTSLNTSTGVISGTVTAAVDASYSFTITATNTDGTVSQAFSGTVQPDLGGNLKLYANGVWSDKEVYVYDGTEWDRGTVYIYNGTSWSKSVF